VKCNSVTDPSASWQLFSDHAESPEKKIISPFLAASQTVLNFFTKVYYIWTIATKLIDWLCTHTWWQKMPTITRTNNVQCQFWSTFKHTNHQMQGSSWDIKSMSINPVVPAKPSWSLFLHYRSSVEHLTKFQWSQRDIYSNSDSILYNKHLPQCGRATGTGRCFLLNGYRLGIGRLQQNQRLTNPERTRIPCRSFPRCWRNRTRSTPATWAAWDRREMRGEFSTF